MKNENELVHGRNTYKFSIANLYQGQSNLPWLKASFSFDLNKVIFNRDPIITGTPYSFEGKGVQLDMGQLLHWLVPEAVQDVGVMGVQVSRQGTVQLLG